MDAADDAGLEGPSQRVIGVEVSGSVEADGGLARPLQLVTTVSVDGIGFDEV